MNKTRKELLARLHQAVSVLRPELRARLGNGTYYTGRGLVEGGVAELARLESEDKTFSLVLTMYPEGSPRWTSCGSVSVEWP